MPDTLKRKIVASAVKSSFGILYIAIETLLPWTLPKTLLYPSFCTRLITTVYEQDCVVLGCELMPDAAFCIVMYNMLCLHEIK